MLSDILDIKKGITAIIGSGGKTTLMLKLAKVLSQKGKVIICTTTHIYPPENIITLVSPSEKDILDAFRNENVVCIGKTAENNKLTSSDIPFERLIRLADYVIAEADGSKHMPLKAHNDYEPVIPNGTDKVILVVGISGIGRKISEVCHRPELYAEIVQGNITDIVSSQTAAEAINKENLGDIIVINQVETEKDMENAKDIARYINKPVYAGEIMKGRLVCLR